MLDLKDGDPVKVVLKDGAHPRGQAASKTLSQTKIRKIQSCNGGSHDSQMMDTPLGIRIVTQRATLQQMPDYLVMRLDSDNQWRLATEPRQ